MSNRPSNHINAQKNGKLRDNNTCQICGSDKKIQGHHIIEYQDGGAGNVDNIVSLCSECHKKVHKGLIDIFKF